MPTDENLNPSDTPADDSRKVSALTPGPEATNLVHSSMFDVPLVDTEQALRSLPSRYQIIDKLGYGGWGQVYRFRDIGETGHGSREVAIKLVRGDLSGRQEIYNRFAQEMHIAEKFDHPNIVQVFTHGKTAQGILYLVMQYIEGGSLLDRLGQSPDGRLGESEVIDLGMQLCAALMVAHGMGVIHRDIKPGNILMHEEQYPRKRIRAKLSDFGLARSLDAPIASQSIAAGTFGYRSPEQRGGKGVDRRSDIYSLGATLYHAAMGESPEGIEWSEVPSGLRPLLRRAMAKSPEDRYRTAQEFYEALEQSQCKPPTAQFVRPGVSDVQEVAESTKPEQSINDRLDESNTEITISPEDTSISHTLPATEALVPRLDPLPTTQLSAPLRETVPRTGGRTLRWLAVAVMLSVVGLTAVWLMVSNSKRVSDQAYQPEPPADAVKRFEKGAMIPSASEAAVPTSPPLSKEPDPTPPKRRLDEEITNSIGMKFRLIPAGTFMMGSNLSPKEVHQRYPGGKEEWYEGETSHRVVLSQSFYMGIHEVTVGQFRRFVDAEKYKTEAETDGEGGWGFDQATGKFTQNPKYTWRNPGFAQDDNHPVVNVSWNDAVAFCRWLSRVEGREYRLPTEAEWEYSCRAGSSSEFSFGDDAEQLVGFGNVVDATLKKQFSNFTTVSSSDGVMFTSRVGSYRSNEFGLYDMHGNVWEWCSDWYETYPTGSVTDPVGPNEGSLRVSRGGGWLLGAACCRSASRYGYSPVIRSYFLGFRVALSSPSGIPQ